jgi:hypothetical protein
VGEVDDAHDAEDQVQSARHQRIHAAKEYAADKQFGYWHAGPSFMPSGEVTAGSRT